MAPDGRGGIGSGRRASSMERSVPDHKMAVSRRNVLGFTSSFTMAVDGLLTRRRTVGLAEIRRYPVRRTICRGVCEPANQAKRIQIQVEIQPSFLGGLMVIVVDFM